MAVNDPFVMQAWGRSQHVPEGLQMLADGNPEEVRADPAVRAAYLDARSLAS